jgi:hypothetical protein
MRRIAGQGMNRSKYDNRTNDYNFFALITLNQQRASFHNSLINPETTDYHVILVSRI